MDISKSFWSSPDTASEKVMVMIFSSLEAGDDVESTTVGLAVLTRTPFVAPTLLSVRSAG